MAKKVTQTKEAQEWIKNRYEQLATEYRQQNGKDPSQEQLRLLNKLASNDYINKYNRDKEALEEQVSKASKRTVNAGKESVKDQAEKNKRKPGFIDFLEKTEAIKEKGLSGSKTFSDKTIEGVTPVTKADLSENTQAAGLNIPDKTTNSSGATGSWEENKTIPENDETIPENDETINKRKNRVKSLLQAYKDNEIDKGEFTYMLGDMFSKKLRKTGDDIGNIGRAWVGGSQINNPEEKSLWEQRNESVWNSAISSMKNKVEGSDDWLNAQGKTYDNFAKGIQAKYGDQMTRAQVERILAENGIMKGKNALWIEADSIIEDISGGKNIMDSGKILPIVFDLAKKLFRK